MFWELLLMNFVLFVFVWIRLLVVFVYLTCRYDLFLILISSWIISDPVFALYKFLFRISVLKQYENWWFFFSLIYIFIHIFLINTFLVENVDKLCMVNVSVLWVSYYKKTSLNFLNWPPFKHFTLFFYIYKKKL